MKRILILAALAATVLASCNTKEIQGEMEDRMNNQELFFSAANYFTKGYVETDAFIDSPFDKLHGQTPDGKTDRTMMMSAYLTPQSGASSNYFVGETFSKNANGETDGKWHHNPKIYWPLGGELSFLAFSSTVPFEGTAIHWNEDNAASKLVLNCSESYLQDDILYAGVYKRSSGASSGANPTGASDVQMIFQHAQAWIQFQLRSEAANLVKVNEIILSGINTRGELTINAPASASANATASWNFNYERRQDFVMPDTYGVYNNPDAATPKYLGTAVEYMDVLLPAEQAQSAIIIHYQLEGQDNVLEYTYQLPATMWNKGERYIYAIEFRPYEIIVSPSVAPWDAGNVPSGADWPNLE